MSRSYFHPRRNRKFGVIAIVVIVVAVLGWIIWPSGEAKLTPAEAGSELQSASNQAAAGRGSTAENLPIVSFGSDDEQGDQPLVRGNADGSNRPDADPSREMTMGQSTPSNQPLERTGTPQPKVTPPPSTTTTEQGAPSRTVASGASSAVATLIAQADAAESRNRPLEARDLLNRALHHPSGTRSDREALRRRLGELNDLLVFSPKIVPGDSLVESYTVEKGDALSRIVKKKALQIEWPLLARINKVDPNRLRIGQSLKIIRGPFHAIVSKPDFRMDIYADERDADGNRLFIRSFPVGLGEFGSTPVGLWVVSERKNVNPDWRNPRTGEYFTADDPANPIGERWIGLEGADANTETMYGYGIHGTVEPESIGREASMGCVRCRDGDIELIYELLVPEESKVEIIG